MELVAIIAAPIITLVGVLIVGILTYKNNRKTADKENDLKDRVHELEKTKVNSEAFNQAKTFYLEMIAQLKEELAAVRVRAESLDREITSERSISSALRNEIAELTAAVERLEAQLSEARLKIGSVTDTN